MFESIITKAHEFGQHVGTYADRLLAGPVPWIRMRQAYGLLRLCERYGADRVDAHCARAIAFDVLDVPRIERMLKQARSAEEAAPAGEVVPLPPSRFARDPSSFATGARHQGARVMAPRTVSPELNSVMKKVRLGQPLVTLAERITLAEKNDTPIEDCLIRLFSDEVERRHGAAANDLRRLQGDRGRVSGRRSRSATRGAGGPSGTGN